MGVGVGVLTPQQLAANSLIAGFDKQLRMKSMLDDIYEQLSGLYVMEKQNIPDVIRMKVDAKALGESVTGVRGGQEGHSGLLLDTAKGVAVQKALKLLLYLSPDEAHIENLAAYVYGRGR